MKKVLRINPNKFLFYIFISLITFGKGIGMGNEDIYLNLFVLIGTCLIIFKLFNEKYFMDELIKCIFLFVIGGISYLISGRAAFLLSIITIIGMKGIEIKKIFALILKIRLFTFTLIILLSSIGVIENNVMRMYRQDKFVTRNALGYLHPNILHVQFFLISVLIVYIYYEKIKVKHIILIEILNVILYSYSVSNTGFLVTSFLLLITLIIKKIHIMKIIFFKCANFILPSIIIFSYSTSLLYNRLKIINVMDYYFNGRIYYGHYFLTNFNLTLFGRNFADMTGIFDDSYILMLSAYGIIPLIFFLLVMQIIIKRYTKMRDERVLILIITLLIYCIGESFLPNIFMNFSLFFIGELIFKKYNSRKLGAQVC